MFSKIDRVNAINKSLRFPFLPKDNFRSLIKSKFNLNSKVDSAILFVILPIKFADLYFLSHSEQRFNSMPIHIISILGLRVHVMTVLAFTHFRTFSAILMAETVFLYAIAIFTIASFVFAIWKQLQSHFLVLEMLWSDRSVFAVDTFAVLWAGVAHFVAHTVVF